MHPDAFVRVSIAEGTAGMRSILHEVPNREAILAEIFAVLEETVDFGSAASPLGTLWLLSSVATDSRSCF